MELTPKAIHRLNEMLEGKNNENVFIRITVDEQHNTSCPKFSVETEKKENEKTTSIEGIPLAMSIETASTLSGYIIDYSSNGFKVDYMLPAGRCCR